MNLLTLIKQKGFYQYNKMYSRFINNNNIAIVRNGDSWHKNKIYIYINNDILLLSENTYSWRIKNSILLINKVYFNKNSPLTDLLIKHNINLLIFLQNYLTNGYNSSIIMRLLHNNKIPEKYITSMLNSNYRHNYTSYDLINKKGLNDIEISFLRKNLTIQCSL
jgi:hypothetical protein